jgi:translation initiation factor IF-3
MLEHGFHKMQQNKFPRERSEDQNRLNWQIRVPQVRVVREEEQLGIMATDEARKLAMDNGLDLVEIAPTAKPPVCRIMDYGRYKYELKIKKKEAAKKQRESQVQIKEIRLRPAIQDHDIETKINQAKNFLEEGCKVQFYLQFKGYRELNHKEQGFAVMKKIVETMEQFGVVEKRPAMEGNRITCFFTPKI